MIEELIDKYKSQNISLYGLGTETERFLNENGSKLSVVGLLDGFKSEGEIYDYPIIPIADTPSKGVKLIIVVARPGSCKAIAKRIGDFCRENEIALYDVRGRDLLDASEVAYDFKNIIGGSRQELMRKGEEADVISFDLFDTLVMRKVKSYTDIFDLVDLRLRDRGVVIPDLAKNRFFAEKELSKDKPPKLQQIYDYVLRTVGGGFIDPDELAKEEWQLDLSLLAVRKSVRDVFNTFVSMGKKVVITTDSYYSREQIIEILNKYNLKDYDDLLVSCEYETAKPQGLFGVLSDKYNREKILHIGDDEFSDIEKAGSFGIDTFRIYSACGLFDLLGGLGAEEVIESIADRVKTGLFLEKIFNNPFWFEDDEKRLSVNNAYDIGYLFCAPMITDFTLWMRDRADKQGYEQMLFGARDGFLVGRLFRKLDGTKHSYYFLTSRTAAIRAGVDSQEDIEYVDSMKYFGSPETALKVRYGIQVEDINAVDRNALILDRAKQQKENYRKYINKLEIDDRNLALFDFVAKGTTQMYLQRLFSQHIKGFYFLQLEPEFMADKGLDIEPFYSDEEKNTSAIFDNYYILETMLTAPYPQMEEMDKEGNPIFVKETRSEQELRVFDRAQQGIIDYFDEYLRILPAYAGTVNKKLDEKLLALVNRVKILDEEFLAIKVEDPFFGRMTDIKDVIG